jgi:hypothetical protein
MKNNKTIFEIINEILKNFNQNQSKYDDMFTDDIKYFIENDENGQYTTEKGDGFIKEEYISEDGNVKYTSYRYLDSFSDIPKMSDTNDKLAYLQYKLDLALEQENYEEAAKLRDEIRSIN